MSQLWRRDWSLTVGTMRISPSGAAHRPLDIVFETEKSTDRSPNTAIITIYNLGSERRASITSPVEVELRAGYVDTGADLIFSGQARKIERGKKKKRGIAYERSGVDILTVLECEDGGTSYRDGQFNRSYQAGTTLSSVLGDLTDAIGIGRGNLAQHASSMRLANESASYVDGVTFSGPGRRTLDRIIRAAGYRWSIQDGALQVRRAGQPAQTTAVRLSPGTGLVGSPSTDADGKVLCTALLIPGLYPGRVVTVESSEVNGNYAIERCRARGSTFADDWNVEMTLGAY